ncbi:MAG: pantetheine-phosphate adenylyltransferase [Candidatus Aenigmarchaeota archaeon]|nr:pantetheine-phosphate adenylyltransferase [Candidatus Aenigmarchaeota archaeon]
MYNTVIVGGTFDRFHVGHEAFLDKAFQSAKKVLIGLTTHSMLKKIVFQNSIWPYERRKKAVEDFVKKYGKEFVIFSIEDIFGPSIEIEDLDAIVATEETRQTCERINQIRKRKGLKPLEIIHVPYVYSEDCRVISSSRIRKEEIDREGRVLVDYLITERLKEELRRPSGKIFEGDNVTVTKDLISYIQEEGFKDVVCIGDEVVHDLLSLGFKPKNIIVDGKVMRKPIDYLGDILKPYAKKFKLKNPAGFISRHAWKTIKEALEKESAVLVKGEEDLLTIPTLLLAKNNIAIIYGQPGRGKVIIKVDDEKKENWRKRLAEFETA